MDMWTIAGEVDGRTVELRKNPDHTYYASDGALLIAMSELIASGIPVVLAGSGRLVPAALHPDAVALATARRALERLGAEHVKAA